MICSRLRAFVQDAEVPTVAIAYILEGAFAQPILRKDDQFVSGKGPGHGTGIILGIATATDDKQIASRGNKSRDALHGLQAQPARYSLDCVDFQYKVKGLLPDSGRVEKVGHAIGYRRC